MIPSFPKIPEEISTDVYHISHDFEKRRQAKLVVYDDLEVQLKISTMAQLKMSRFVRRTDIFQWDGQTVIGIDVSYDNNTAFGCAVELDVINRSVIKRETHYSKCELPYIPSHFYLREGPIILELVRRFGKTIVMVDGNGILHPRRFGLASYVGVMFDLPTIGVTKRLLLGTLSKRCENRATIEHDGDVLGSAVWIGERKRPIYVSVGHNISLETAIKIVQLTSKFGYPEPLRQAHLCSKQFKKNGA